MQKSQLYLCAAGVLGLLLCFATNGYCEAPQILFAKLHKPIATTIPTLSNFIYVDGALTINFVPAINQVIELKREENGLELFVTGAALGEALKADLPYFGNASQTLYDFIIFNPDNNGVLIKIAHSPTNIMQYAITNAGLVIGAQG